MVPDTASRGDSTVTVSDKPVVAAWHFGLVLNITCVCVGVYACGGSRGQEGDRM